ncbi:hypothetical protein CHS0354_004285 [Potamilus streckersoni]|uniref:G domain-containing protein n=1 Tax=Potamilus streckersoni TaxID=2493646 RepID=A0AAE0S4Q6_9BIVA|nr:hypothetical protein CHS0354_004285 [Potamilus streckersoni]
MLHVTNDKKGIRLMADTYAEENNKMNEETQKKELYLQKIIKSSGTKNPLNVCVIGMYGVGKSSFINTIAAALNGKCWTEHAYVGNYDGTRGVTTFVQRFRKCCQEDNEKYNYVSLPTLYDLAGFPDDDCISTEEILRIFFFGKLRQGAAIQEAIDYFKEHGILGLKQKYSGSVNDKDVNKIDRIIFVASARENLPVKLIKCVLKAAQPTASSEEKYARSIPIFGVLTHAGPMEMDKHGELEHERGGDREHTVTEKSGDVEHTVTGNRGDLEHTVTRKRGDVEHTETGKSGVLEHTVTGQRGELEHKEINRLEDKKLQFMRNLGIVSHRLLVCSNYCDDVDGGNRVENLLPKIDLPVLRFLVQVFDRNLAVINDHEMYNETSLSPSIQETSPSNLFTSWSAWEHHYRMLQTPHLIIICCIVFVVLGEALRFLLSGKRGTN